MTFKYNSKNKKFLLVIIFFLLLVSAGFFLWLNFSKESNINYEVSVVNQVKNKTISIKEGIKNAFLKKYPDWKNNNFNIFIEEESPNYAMGTITWEKHRGKAFWLAVKTDDQWLIASHGGGGYFGVCQDFTKYNFPSEMTPDCWDEEQKILINTPNPDRFYNGLTIEDKEKIKQAFLDFKKDNVNFQDKKIYVKFNEIMGNYLRGVVLIGGIENHSAPHFFAVKNNNNWKVLYYGQEDPPCENIEGYNFPVEMIFGCWITGNNWIKR